MECSTDNSKVPKYNYNNSYEQNILPKNLNISNMKLALKNNEITKDFDRNFNTYPSGKIKKFNKRVKFKENNLIEVVDVESFKKYNFNNNFNENIKPFGVCDCKIL